jgi:hypothetical protein
VTHGYARMEGMDDERYAELLHAILDLRSATELGFDSMNRRFDDVYARFDALEERWDRRFGALERRVEDGFRAVSASLDDVRRRLSIVERR